MDDDTRGRNLAPFAAKDRAEMQNLWKFKVNRTEAEQWVLRDMKFLIYDDSDEKTDVYGTGEYVDGQEDRRAVDSVALSLKAEEVSPGAAPTPAPPSSDAGPSVTFDCFPCECGRVGCEKTRGAGHFKDWRDSPTVDVSSWSSDKCGDCELSERECYERKRNAGEKSHTCKICTRVPEFPSDRKTRTFRLFSPSVECPEIVETPDCDNICGHFVAISHCWPLPALDGCGEDQKPKTCRVREKDGTTRTARALDDVLDRAVDFANMVGFRMIWIDHECLPQPTEESPQEDKEYQRIGVQAMDMVYQRALVTASLHEGLVVSQQQVDAIDTLLDPSNSSLIFEIYNPPSPGQPNEFRLAVTHAIEFLQAVVNDRSYTRAWVAQEAVSAGIQRFLVFRRAPAVVGRTRLRGANSISHKGRPRHSLDDQEPKLPFEVIGIAQNEFYLLLRKLKLCYRSFGRPSTWDLRLLHHNALSTIRAAEALQPNLTLKDSGWLEPRISLPTLYGDDRKALSAATALTLLSTRECRDTQDRIPILANMCRYELRIETADAVANCRSLRVAILSLALLNSDLSLLVPEMYWCRETTVSDDGNTLPGCICDVRYDGGLFSPFDRHPGNISDPDPQSFDRFKPTTNRELYGAGPVEGGLRMAAYLWTAEKELDLGFLRDQHCDTWNSLKTIIVDCEGSSDARIRQMGKRLEPGIDVKFERGIRAEVMRSEDGILPKSSALWGDLPPGDEKFRLGFDTDRIEENPPMQQTLAEVVFDILGKISRFPHPLAAGLADSIWQSLRVGVVPGGQPDLPDVVCDELFAHPDVVAQPFETLKLDKDMTNLGGGYHQTWFVERIMQRGKLWVWRYNRPAISEAAQQETPADTDIWAQDATRGLGGRPTVLAGKGKEPEIPNEAAGPRGLAISFLRSDTRLFQFIDSMRFIRTGTWTRDFRTTEYRDIEAPKRAGVEADILRRQAMERRLRDLYMGFAYRYMDDIPGLPKLGTGNLIAFALKMEKLRDFGRGGLIAEQDLGPRPLAATFDVDGSCVVATPYNPAWEVIPAPAMRSMSTCWVVEEVPDDAGGGGDEEHDAVATESTAAGQGEEDAPGPGGGGLEEAEEGTKQEADQNEARNWMPSLLAWWRNWFVTETARGKQRRQGLGNDQASKYPQRGNKRTLDNPFGYASRRFKVVRKVKGMRKIMDLPDQTHIFE
ncbi:hypothetical protein GGTG_02087 [Gaeumannomyces tritici R3-111a-1]|uniref:Heterokaryon incompatibility domain-containing protein n=1 Tax=Gaeumannomyces tritici (strain R3-111a-1) TaxID=644352 RepID=J3NLD9_GAET3|nr:hypothetical protein GGTG_02087 [Gaeumannomyces tritici R3-111a-1]EJT82113.1 hypothetical protein GGTG_02087 [Gaeumannomyces tritici R3-111a-1]